MTTVRDILAGNKLYQTYQINSFSITQNLEEK